MNNIVFWIGYIGLIFACWLIVVEKDMPSARIVVAMVAFMWMNYHVWHTYM